MDNKNTYFEECAISYLPIKMAEAVRKSSALYRGAISEIRLREGGNLCLTVRDKNVQTPYRCSCDDINNTVRSLCGNSLYSHSETIKDGYICTDGGLRAGVCGRAVTEGGRIISVTDIKSIAIRIPHRVPGASDEICKMLLSESFRGMIIYSPPGVGKTTALREIAARMGAAPYNLRIAVIDTRFEICGGLSGEYSIDALSGYPRAKGMETALRTLSPQLMICDEIANKEDANAVKESFGSGVPVIVSAHALSERELLKKPYIGELWNMGAFSHCVGLSRSSSGFEMKTTLYSETE